jgi:hypothetical protein
MFERGERQRIIGSSLLFAMGVAIGLVGMLVLAQAGPLGEPGVSGAVTVVFGPWQLMHIVKTPLENGGSVATFEAKDGLFFYATAWLLVGAVAAYVRLRLADREEDIA